MSNGFVWFVLALPFAAIVGIVLWDARDKGAPSSEKTLASWTKVLGLATCLLFIATAYSAYVLNLTDHTLRDAAIATNRAWIAPSNIAIEGPLTEGQPFAVRINFSNVGKTPAIVVPNFYAIERADTDQVVPGTAGKPPPMMGPNRTCEGLSVPEGGQVVYPDTSARFAVTTHFQGKLATKDLMAGKSLLALQGCFLYRTQGEVHKSAFCMIVKRDNYAAGVAVNYCGDGNFAD